MPKKLEPMHPGEVLREEFLGQLTVADDRGHRSQAGISAGPVEVASLTGRQVRGRIDGRAAET